MNMRLLRRPAVRGILGAASVAALLTGLTSAPAHGAVAATGQITGVGGKCVDVAGANSANGTPIQLYDCNGSAAQQWTVGGAQRAG
ncbi:ricin-type beta-trefoil lectin domain protein [Streptomyces sp. NPDC059474]|uniref:ricin-type beta-trefoil lectin domain protein n=1 Tax=Streptomyces sp. NPDC059474 TaxID=3346846 RepID=UPI00367D7DDD